jgi:putative (di)nucleoside polyphosphate hydrolase
MKDPQSNPPKKLYRPVAGIVLLNSDDKIFLAERLPNTNLIQSNQGQWQMPQGGIDPGENPLEAAKRELYEETGIKSIEFLANAPEKTQYNLPHLLASQMWGGIFTGVTIDWFLFRFVGEDSEVNLNVFDPPEFGKWMWSSPDEAIQKVVDFKKDSYRNVFKHFRQYFNG